AHSENKKNIKENQDLLDEEKEFFFKANDFFKENYLHFLPKPAQPTQPTGPMKSAFSLQHQAPKMQFQFGAPPKAITKPLASQAHQMPFKQLPLKKPETSGSTKEEENSDDDDFYGHSDEDNVIDFAQAMGITDSVDKIKINCYVNESLTTNKIVFSHNKKMQITVADIMQEVKKDPKINQLNLVKQITPENMNKNPVLYQLKYKKTILKDEHQTLAQYNIPYSATLSLSLVLFKNSMNS
ncbi:MAG: hypothetical protein AAF380_01675, partial [Bacteroidota bacterium]